MKRVDLLTSGADGGKMFALVDADVWRLRSTIGPSRRQRLLTTTFEDIVDQTKASVEVVSFAMMPLSKGSDYERLEIAIELPAPVVDQFHNGAGGYRAQYYESPTLGEQANRHVLNALQELFDVGGEIARKSIEHVFAKIWIREGSWRDDRLDADQNLEVKRWQDFAEQNQRIILSLGFDPFCARLTPGRETKLEIKGAWIHKVTSDVLDLKPGRSQTLHNWGFT